MALKIPAIRSKMGIWFYYVSSLSFENVAQYVSPIDDELHHSELLSGMIQRSITINYKSIANYLATQDGVLSSKYSRKIPKNLLN